MCQHAGLGPAGGAGGVEEPQRVVIGHRGCGGGNEFKVYCTAGSLAILLDLQRFHAYAAAEDSTAQWTLQQIVEVFPWDTAPKYLLRDRDATHGEMRVTSMASSSAAQPAKF